MNQITLAGARCVEHISSSGATAIFFNGKGEAKNVRDSWDALYVHGPAKELKNGWAPSYMNLYCVQTPVMFPSSDWVTQVIDAVAAKAHVDKERIYALGLSAGAITWANAMGYHASIAARIAGFGCLSGNWQAAIDNAQNIPIRAIHGKSDTTVYPTSIKAKIPAMQQAGYKYKELYLLPGGHTGQFWETWFDPEVGINGKNIYRWLRQFKVGGIKL